MSPAEVVAQLRRQGFHLEAAETGVRVRPASRLIDVHRALIRAHKADLQAALAANVLPCPKCARPLDRSECCWTCRVRLCQRCGQAMPKPYALECDRCLERIFAQSSVPDPKAFPQMHPCACGKLIPPSWDRCTTCDPDWRQTTPRKESAA